MEEIPIKVIEDKAFKRGYDEGLVFGELKAIARIKKNVKSYLAKQQKLYDKTDGKQGLNFANSDVEDILMKLILGEKL